jgi:hypothetical protein
VVVDVPPWLVRIGAILLLVSPLLSQAEAGGGCFRPLGFGGEFGMLTSGVARLGVEAWLSLPALAGLAILLSVRRRSPPGPVPRAFLLALLMAVCFAMATLGSVQLTRSATGAAGPRTSFPLELLLFLLPLLLGGVALARVVGGDVERSSGGFARLSIGLLLALHGLFLLDGGWELLLDGIKQSGAVRTLPGAWAAPAGGLLVAAGEACCRLRPRVAVDRAPANG